MALDRPGCIPDLSPIAGEFSNISLKLPFHKVGSHRRISAGDVLDYKRARKAESRDKMESLAEDDEKLDVEY